MAAAETLHILFAQQLGIPVSGNRRGLAAFVDRRAAVGAVGRAGEDVVGGDVDKPGADLVAGKGKVARAEGVDLEGHVAVGLAAVDIGGRRAVDDGIGLVAADIGHGRLAVGDIELVDVHRDDRGFAQAVGQRAEHATFVGQLVLQLGAQLPAAAGDEDLHSVCVLPLSI